MRKKKVCSFNNNKNMKGDDGMMDESDEGKVFVKERERTNKSRLFQGWMGQLLDCVTKHGHTQDSPNHNQTQSPLYDESNFSCFLTHNNSSIQKWNQITCLGSIPSIRRGHSLVADPESDYLYLYGGYFGNCFRELHRFHTLTYTWELIPIKGDLPDAVTSHAGNLLEFFFLSSRKIYYILFEFFNLKGFFYFLLFFFPLFELN
jgi:hypothetical protein